MMDGAAVDVARALASKVGAGSVTSMSLIANATMKINPACKLETVCSKDPFRYVLAEPYLDLKDKGDPKVVATNGVSLVVMPVTVHDDETEGVIPIPALKLSRTLGRKSGNEGTIWAINGTAKCVNDQTFPRADVVYPNWREVLPEKRSEGIRFSLDARELLKIADALGTPTVTLVLRRDDPSLGVAKVLPCSLRPAENNKAFAVPEPRAFGLISPIRTQ